MVEDVVALGCVRVGWPSLVLRPEVCEPSYESPRAKASGYFLPASPWPLFLNMIPKWWARHPRLGPRSVEPVEAVDVGMAHGCLGRQVARHIFTNH